MNSQGKEEAVKCQLACSRARRDAARRRLQLPVSARTCILHIDWVPRQQQSALERALWWQEYMQMTQLYLLECLQSSIRAINSNVQRCLHCTHLAQ